jgi:CBS domain containing-hemolysin-like protein
MTPRLENGAPMTEWALIGIGFVLVLGTGMFVAAEFSLVALDRSELERRRNNGERGLGRIIKGLTITSTHLSSAQLGITITTLLTGYTLEPAFSDLLNEPLAALGVPPELRRVITAPLAIIIATFLSMIIGELFPKNWAITEPLRVAKFVMPFQAGFTFVFRPAIVLLNNSANGILRSLGLEPKEELSGARSAEELSALVRHSASAGKLEADTASLLDRTIRFSELSAADAMTPRMRIEGIQKLDSADAVLKLSGKTGFSRFPVIGEDQDDIVGVVHLKQAIAVPRAKRHDVPVAALQEDALRVPETMKLDVLLHELRGSGFQMAVVVDEYGGTAGIVTLEDLVEEIIGEVADEHDRATAGIVMGIHSFTFPASLRPDEVSDRTGLIIPEDDAYDTVAGFVMRELGRIPLVGDEVEVLGGSLRVERLDGRRIDRLRFTPVVTEVSDE